MTFASRSAILVSDCATVAPSSATVARSHRSGAARLTRASMTTCERSTSGVIRSVPTCTGSPASIHTVCQMPVVRV